MHLADMSVYGITIFNYAKEIGILDYVAVSYTHLTLPTIA